MKPTDSTYFLIKSVEGEKLEAYQCPAKVWTISLGVTYYPDGTHVKQGDKITAPKSMQLFKECSDQRVEPLNKLITSNLTQHQWDVAFSINWQYGNAWLKKSLFLKQLNANPNDLSSIKHILCDLMEYKGRRLQEYEHYIK